jgi:multiple sugar transport system substrate-binding protein
MPRSSCNTKRFARLYGVAPAALLAAGCDGQRGDPDGRVVVRYWDKWSGSEANAMQQVVDDFNTSQDRIRAEYSSVSQINRKLMLAIGDGNPPDVAGLFGNTLAVYPEKNALIRWTSSRQKTP